MDKQMRVFWFVMGWTNGMELPAYIDGPFLNREEARRAAIDWMFSGRADVYSTMATAPQEAFTYRDAAIAAENAKEMAQ